MTNEIGALLGKPKENKKYKPDERWVLPKSFIGLEFEYEGVKDPDGLFYNNPSLAQYWASHRDDSLKDHGCEFVFRNPMFGADAYEALKVLMDLGTAHQFKCSLRAGLHVHLDVRDMETSQLIGLIVLYTILEPLIFDWVGNNREHSIYCVPLFKADESLADAVRVVRAVQFDEKHEGSKNTYNSSFKAARYAALNLNALSKFGSIEFRHMKTTLSMDKVVDWVNIIQSLKAATTKLPTSDGAIIKIAQTQSPTVFLTYLFGPRLAQQLWTPQSAHQIKMIGIPTALDLVLNGLSLTSSWDEPSTLDVPKGRHEGFYKFLESIGEALPPAPKKRKVVPEWLVQPPQHQPPYTYGEDIEGDHV